MLVGREWQARGTCGKQEGVASKRICFICDCVNGYISSYPWPTEESGRCENTYWKYHSKDIGGLGWARQGETVYLCQQTYKCILEGALIRGWGYICHDNTFLTLSSPPQICHPSGAALLHKLIKNSEIVIIKNCGHAIPVDRPRKTAKILEKFISQNRSISNGWFVTRSHVIFVCV